MGGTPPPSTLHVYFISSMIQQKASRSTHASIADRIVDHIKETDHPLPRCDEVRMEFSFGLHGGRELNNDSGQ